MLKDQTLQQELESKGFVKMPMLSHNEVEELRQLFKSLKSPDINGIYSNIYDQSFEMNIVVRDTVHRLFSPYIEKAFTSEYKIDGGVFLVKSTGDKSECNLHQDWNIVDEEKFCSLSIWCPLVDVDEHNGALLLAEGSHKLFKTIRSVTMPSPYMPIDKDIEPFLTLVPAKAGEAIIFYHNTFHGSVQNHSSEVRVAIAAGVLPINAQRIHYYETEIDDQRKLIAAVVDPNFYISNPLKFTIQDALAGPHHAVNKSVPPTLTRERFIEVMNNKKGLKKSGNAFYRFLKNLF